MKPHIRFHDGAWKMERLVDRQGYPLMLVTHATAREAFDYFRVQQRLLPLSKWGQYWR